VRTTQPYAPEPPSRRSPRLARIVLATALLLLVPLVAMRFTDEVAWTPGDFVVMGTLLVSAGLVYERATRKAGGAASRLGVGAVVFAVFVLIWAVLAVGLD
jgi:hypothetical protein